MHNNILATVDLGSNSFRLLIAKVLEDGTLHQIDQIKETVRLAGGLDQSDNLTRESQLIALEVLARFGERLAGLKKNQVRVVATSTLRIARNAEDFIAIANKTLGFNIEIISGTEEARLIYIGAMHSLAYSEDKRLVIDIGGGSTEFVTGRGYQPKVMESVTMGCVSFSNRYFSESILSETNFTTAILAARSKIQAMEHLFAKHDWTEAVGTSGTARALYDLCVDNGFSDQLTLAGLYKLKKQLIKSRSLKNVIMPGLKEDRKPVIAGGLSIMIAVMEELQIDIMTIADGALREGVMYDLLGRKTNQDLRPNTIARLKERYAIDEDQSQRIANIALILYQQLTKSLKVNNDQTKLLEWACNLYEIGLTISHSDYHKHGAYILANADLAGFSKPEQTVLSDLVRSHRGSLSKAIDSLKNKKRAKTKLLIMMLAFRLAVIFNRNRKNIANNIINVAEIDKKAFDLIIDGAWLYQNPLTLHSLNEEISEWKKLNIKIKLNIK